MNNAVQVYEDGIVTYHDVPGHHAFAEVTFTDGSWGCCDVPKSYVDNPKECLGGFDSAKGALGWFKGADALACEPVGDTWVVKDPLTGRLVVMPYDQTPSNDTQEVSLFIERLAHLGFEMNDSKTESDGSYIVMMKRIELEELGIVHETVVTYTVATQRIYIRIGTTHAFAISSANFFKALSHGIANGEGFYSIIANFVTI